MVNSNLYSKRLRAESVLRRIAYLFEWESKDEVGKHLSQAAQEIAIVIALLNKRSRGPSKKKLPSSYVTRSILREIDRGVPLTEIHERFKESHGVGLRAVKYISAEYKRKSVYQVLAGTTLAAPLK